MIHTLGPPQYARAGDPAAWAGTMLIASDGQLVYSIDNTGVAYATNLNTGEYRQLGTDYMGTRFLVAIAGLAYTIDNEGALWVINTQGEYQAVSPAGTWVGTTAVVAMFGRIYAICQGLLYSVDPGSGQWGQLGSEDWSTTRLMVAGADWLDTIDQDGTLYSVDPNTGGWAQAGEPGTWVATRYAAGAGPYLFSIENSGDLYVTDPRTGEYKKLGEGYSQTQFFFAVQDTLFSIEANGDMYQYMF